MHHLCAFVYCVHPGDFLDFWGPETSRLETSVRGLYCSPSVAVSDVVQMPLKLSSVRQHPSLLSQHQTSGLHACHCVRARKKHTVPVTQPNPWVDGAQAWTWCLIIWLSQFQNNCRPSATCSNPLQAQTALWACTLPLPHPKGDVGDSSVSAAVLRGAWTLVCQYKEISAG